MTLSVGKVQEIIEDMAPVYMKIERDNIGLMVGESEAQITSLLIALDCTLEVIKEALDKGCNMIVTHHPLLFMRPSTITSETLQGKKILELIKHGIHLYACHTNLDMVRGGLNDMLVELLGFQTIAILEPYNGKEEYHNDGSIGSNNGIGRLVSLETPVTLGSLCDKVMDVLQLPYVRYAGNAHMLIKKIAVVNGSGEDYFEMARSAGADCIITGDTSYHYVSDYRELGLGVIDAGHFGTEWPAMKHFGKVLQNRIQTLGYSNAVILSENTLDPYHIR